MIISKHRNSYLTIYWLTQDILYKIPGFQQKIIRHPKRQGKHFEKNISITTMRFNDDKDVELFDRTFKINVTNTLKSLMEKLDCKARSDG